jgi:hypothetical protein
MSSGRFVFAALAAGALAGCSTAHLDTRPTAGAERLYDRLYPYYVEVCAVSELKKKPGFRVEVSSGMGGHSIIYLNGVCRDPRSGYPDIRLCGADTPPDERGVGLSVNAHFKNSMWVATPGRDFLFHGTLKPGERLTRAVYEETLARAKALGLYDGIRFHAGVFDDMPQGMSRRDYKYEVSVATDYAVGFGRDRYCARVPVDRAQMAEVVDFLNGLNAPYRSGSKSFEWNILNNNCSHVSHNALASVGIWDRWPTGEPAFLAAFDFPVPKNEFVDLMRRTNDLPIDDLDAVYADRAARRALLRQSSLPTEPGALAEAQPADQANEVYDTDLHLIFYDDPIFGDYRRHFSEIFAAPRYTDLEANLQHFAALYRKIEEERRPLAAFLAAHAEAPASERETLVRFYRGYYRYIARAAATVAAQLAELKRASPALAAPAGAPPDHGTLLPRPSRQGASPGVPGS